MIKPWILHGFLFFDKEVIKIKSSIRIRIIFIFATILVIFTFSSIWSIINFNRLSKSIDNIMESNYRSIEAAQNMIIAIERQDSAELALMFSQSEETVMAFNENEKEFIAWLSRAEDNITENGELEILQEINTSYIQYIASFKELLNLSAEKESSSVNDYYYNTVLPLFEQTKSASRELLSLNQNSMLDRKERAHDIATNATISTIVLSISVVIISLILVTLLTNKIINPLNNLIEKIKSIAEGNYNQRLEISGDYEIRQLAEEFNNMAEKLVLYDEQSVDKLRQEKNKSEAIVNSISDGILVLDQEHRIKLLNHNAENIFNVLEHEVMNKHLLEVINHEKLFSLFKTTQEHPYDLSFKKYDNIEISDQDGVNYYRVSIRPVKTKSGDSFGMVALIQDITKFKEVDQIKSDFISTVSHEFRTPLTSITMGVGLLLEEIPGKLTDKQKILVEAIEEDSNRLSKLVNELLDLSKLESGKMKMDYQKHDIREVVDYVIKLFRIQTDDIGAEIHSYLPESLNPVRIDVNKITWVISNLISNALRYIPKDGSGIIEIKAKEVYNKQIISIRDNGSGMSESVQKHIFDKFSQGSDSPGGAGLGLTICKEIIRSHGGDIWVESSLNEGTTFYFTLKNA